MYFVKFKSFYISVFQYLKAYFTVNSSLSVVTQVIIKHRMFAAVDISALSGKYFTNLFLSFAMRYCDIEHSRVTVIT